MKIWIKIAYLFAAFTTFTSVLLYRVPVAASEARIQNSLPVAKSKLANNHMIQLKIYNQWDARWGSKKLIPSQWTMANSGCFITSLTMALNNYAIDLTPGEVLDKLVAVNGVDASGLMTYDGVERAFPWVDFYNRYYTTNDPSNNGLEMQPQAAIDHIRRLLDLGQPTIFAVDNIGNDGIPDHAVVAYDYMLENGAVVDFAIQDPAGGIRTTFRMKYGDPLKKLYGYVALIGPPVQFPAQSTDTEDGATLWKLSQANRGFNTKQYIKEAIDSLI